MTLNPILAASTALVVVGLLLLLNALLAPRTGPDVLKGIARYGEPGWGEQAPSDGEPHLANTDMVHIRTRNQPALFRLIKNIRESRKKQTQSRPTPTTVTSPMARKLILGSLPLSPFEWMMVRVAVCAAIAGLVYLRLHSVIFAPLIGVAGGFIGTGIFLNMRVNKRQAKFERQLLDVISVISAGMKSGSTFAQALEYVTGHVDAPAGPEFARVSREAQLGIPMDECLFHLAERNQSNELRLLINALIVNRRVGGNLSSILEILGETIRMRIKIKGDVKTLTAQATMSGYMISALPAGLLLILMAISPNYIGPMFTSPIGIGMLVGGAVFVLIGLALMKAVTKVPI